MQQTMSPFYTFLTYLQLGTIITTFLLTIIGIIVAIIGIKALLVYIKKNSTPKAAATLENLPDTFAEAELEEATATVEAVVEDEGKEKE